MPRSRVIGVPLGPFGLRIVLLTWSRFAVFQDVCQTGFIFGSSLKALFHSVLFQALFQLISHLPTSARPPAVLFGVAGFPLDAYARRGLNPANPVKVRSNLRSFGELSAVSLTPPGDFHPACWQCHTLILTSPGDGEPSWQCHSRFNFQFLEAVAQSKHKLHTTRPTQNEMLPDLAQAELNRPPCRCNEGG